MTATEGNGGSPLQVKLKNKKDDREEWMTIGVYVGHKDGLNAATLITDDTYFNFIIPMLEKLSTEFGKSVQADNNKAKKCRQKLNAILKDEESDFELRKKEKQEIVYEVNNQQYHKKDMSF